MHQHGALIGAQLVHDGANSRLDIERGVPLLVPSKVRPRSPDRLTTMVTADEASALMRPFTQPTSKLEVREATDADLAAVIDSFASAAARVVAAGFDAIEVHAGHGYLLDAFLSPASNHRVDKWGGDVAGRSLLLIEVIRAVRAAVGPGVGVWMRINAEERYTEGGETLDDTLAVLALAEAAGIDAVHVSAYSNPMVGIGITDAHTPHEPGLLVPLVRAVAAVATVPVIGFGRLEPDAANELIASGGASFVAMGRKLLADADLPRKLAEGRIDDVRPCIYHYRCIGNIFLSEPLACVAASATGHGDESVPPPAASPKSIVVVGGGPAGLEAARLLAASGHRVALYEAADELGGRLRLAAACDPTMEQLLAWLIRQVEQAGVDVHLGVRFAAALLNPADGGSTADLVVDATGTAWPGVDPLGPWLRGDVTASAPGFDVAIVGGDRPGLSLARAMLRHGRRVTVVEPSGVFGQTLGLPGRFREVHDLEQLGARLVTELPPERFDTVIDTAPSSPRPLHDRRRARRPDRRRHGLRRHRGRVLVRPQARRRSGARAFRLTGEPSRVSSIARARCPSRDPPAGGIGSPGVGRVARIATSLSRSRAQIPSESGATVVAQYRPLCRRSKRHHAPPRLPCSLTRKPVVADRTLVGRKAIGDTLTEAQLLAKYTDVLDRAHLRRLDEMKSLASTADGEPRRIRKGQAGGEDVTFRHV